MTGTEIKLLDHGYIKLVERWGSDEDIVRAARMSTGKGFLGWGKGRCKKCGRSPEDLVDIGIAGDDCRDGDAHDFDVGDEKLLRYLYKNRHDTPFEMAGMIVEVRAPIIVFREWHRHRTFSYNEASARYAPLPALDYVPSVQRMIRGGGHLTKQAAAHGDVELTEQAAKDFLERLEKWQRDGEQIYQLGLAWGVPKELARLAMSVGRFSTMRAQANLRNWFHFFGLRRAKNAQEEIRVYADAAFGIAKELFPRSCALFEEGFKG